MNDSLPHRLTAFSPRRRATGSAGPQTPLEAGCDRQPAGNNPPAHVLIMGEDHLHIRLGKHFTGSDLLALTKCLFELESVVERSPHRIMNLLKTETVTLNFSDLLTFARIRRETRLKNHVRFALVVNTPEKYGVMRMLQAVDTHPLTEIGIFLDFTSALKWIRGEPGIFCRGFPPGTQSRE